MRCLLIIAYSLPEQPSFVVSHLSDRAFNNGFRILNPEFSATSTKIAEDEEALKELLHKLDEQTPTDFYNKRWNTHPKKDVNRRTI